MLGKTKVEATEKAGTRLLPKSSKGYRYVALTQIIVFAVMHIVLGFYFAFVSSEYANHPGFTAKIEAHRYLDQIFAIAFFALFVVGLREFYALMKHKKITTLYYIYMAVSAILPLVYLVLSGNMITDAMATVLEEGYPEFLEGGTTNAIAFWTGIEFGAWANGGDVTEGGEVILDYLSRIGAEADAVVTLADFNLSDLLHELRVDMDNWNKFEAFSIVNAVVSAAFVVCGIFLLPLKKIFKK